MTAARFGEVPAGADAIVRPGAYAVVERGGMILTVHTGERVFLPGGGLHARETPLEGLRREVREETGFGLEAAEPLWEAEQVVRLADGRVVVKACRFFRCIVGETVAKPSDIDHAAVWLRDLDAVMLLAETASAAAVAVAIGLELSDPGGLP